MGKCEERENNAIIDAFQKVEKLKLVNVEFFSQEDSGRDWALLGAVLIIIRSNNMLMFANIFANLPSPKVLKTQCR